ncbi:heterokaryon incompatibility protein-domain-containing protein [Pestalotiopsis sp. NC0098]|nr:heterokaryon incompatibility protein-domain-containing protein [Pestalotiopsis sp. NC0098]
MRLLNVKTLKIEEFHSDDQCPPYVILSHTWGSPQQECTLQSMQEPVRSNVTSRDGYQKIKQCCAQAVEDGFEWAWVDTCCIDKTSTAELSEAINSMFRWYKKAAICYAYISDAATVDDFDKSRWFTRGWTLQELVAPPVMRFYSSSWDGLGTKIDLKDVISRITGIDAEVLETGHLGHVTLARKMSWAANRQTTRAEDRAYCLLGIFDVTMPLLYGEGSRSFIRLQEEIMKSGHDYTLFAWGRGPICDSQTRFPSNDSLTSALAPDSEFTGLLASSPALFTDYSEIVPLEDVFEGPEETIVAAGGMVIRLPTFYKEGKTFAALPCLHNGKYVAFPFHRWHEKYVAREAVLLTAETNDLYTEKGALRLQKLFIKAPTSGPPRAPAPSPNVTHSAVFTITAEGLQTLDFCRSSLAKPERAPYYVELPSDHAGIHVACVIRPAAPKMSKCWDTAILLGGKVECLWIAAVPILSEKETEDSFYNLLSVSPNLIRCCATKNLLLAELASGTDSTMFAQPGQKLVKFIAAIERKKKEVYNGRTTNGNVRKIKWIKYQEKMFFKAEIKEVDRHPTKRLVSVTVRKIE